MTSGPLPRFEYLDHTADILIRAYGVSLEEAIAHAGLALGALMVGGESPEGDERESFTVESVDREGLVVAFLSRLIWEFDAEQRVGAEFSVSFEKPSQLKINANWCRLDPASLGAGVDVKGVSYHMMEMGRDEHGRDFVQVLVDV